MKDIMFEVWLRIPYIAFILGVIGVVIGIWVLFPPITVLTSGIALITVSMVEDRRRESMSGDYDE